jgi:hypothetical protein
MHLRQPDSSQLSCPNQTVPLRQRWSIAGPERVAGAGPAGGLYVPVGRRKRRLTGVRAGLGVYAERAADWAVRDIPEKHSATERNIFAGSAAYRNWAIKSPSSIMSAQTRKGSNENSPGAGLAAPGFTYGTIV